MTAGAALLTAFGTTLGVFIHNSQSNLATAKPSAANSSIVSTDSPAAPVIPDISGIWNSNVIYGGQPLVYYITQKGNDFDWELVNPPGSLKQAATGTITGHDLIAHWNGNSPGKTFGRITQEDKINYKILEIQWDNQATFSRSP